MGGVDKPSLTVGGVSLLDRVLLATAGAGQTVVVGPARSTVRPVLWAREEPAGAGPVAAVQAGLALVTAPFVLLLAADQPFLCPAVLGQLLDAVVEDGALLIDGSGQDQYLCSAWRTAALRTADFSTDRLGGLLAGLKARRLTVTLSPPPWTDCDTQEDLDRARELVT